MIKVIENLTNFKKNLVLIGIHRQLSPPKEYTWKISKTDYIIGHKTTPSQKKVELCKVCSLNKIKLEINKKIF